MHQMPKTTTMTKKTSPDHKDIPRLKIFGEDDQQDLRMITKTRHVIKKIPTHHDQTYVTRPNILT